MGEINTKDALGNPIVMGKTYGYSTDSNGFTRSTIGNVTKINPENGNISLKVIKSVRGLYFDEPDEKGKAKSVSVKSMKLFPINANDIKDKPE